MKQVNQTKSKIEKNTIISGFEKIDTSLATIANSQFIQNVYKICVEQTNKQATTTTEKNII